MKTTKKTFILLYLDKGNNELKKDEISAYSAKEARATRDKVFASCMINDCVKITCKKA